MRMGVDLGGTKIEAALLDDAGAVVARERLPTPCGNYDKTLEVIATLVSRLERQCTKVSAVGVATPGSVSKLTGLMRNCNSTCLNGRALQADLETRLKRQVVLANDADCFALSEARDGAGRGYKTLFGVILGTGVGGGICYQGQLLCGPNRITGEWGHNPMPPVNIKMKGKSSAQPAEARPCYCGRSDCVETYLSGPALSAEYALACGDQLEVAQIVARAKKGEARANAVLDRYCERLAAALATVINLLDPDAIVLGGGLSNIEALYEQVPKRWARYVFSDRCETKLLAPRYGDSSGVRGAAWLVANSEG